MNDDIAELKKQVRNWIEIAEEDLRVAKHSFTLESNIPYRIICYHAQQCAEKYLKAFLVSKLIEFPYTQSIDYLLKLIQPIEPITEILNDACELTNYAIAKRYPGEYKPLTKQDAEKSVQLAEKVKELISNLLSQNNFL